jgi:hypothetical protein
LSRSSGKKRRHTPAASSRRRSSASTAVAPPKVVPATSGVYVLLPLTPAQAEALREAWELGEALGLDVGKVVTGIRSLVDSVRRRR